MLKNWLTIRLDTEITAHALRKAEYGHGKAIGLKTAQDVYNLYQEEIEAHNLNRLERMKGKAKK